MPITYVCSHTSDLEPQLCLEPNGDQWNLGSNTNKDLRTATQFRHGAWRVLTVRNLYLGAPLSAALANGNDTLSITADCNSTAGTDAAITAALLAYYTSAQERRTRRRAAPSQPRCWPLHLGAGRRAVGRLPHGKRAGHADAAAIAGAAGLPDGLGPGRVHNQPSHLGAGGVPLSRRPRRP